MRSLRASVLATAIVLASAPAAFAGTGFTQCRESPFECTTVNVPIDRSGGVPGQIALHVERAPVEGTARDAVFALAGGPGQGASSIGINFNNDLSPILTGGRQLYVMDQRGTGKSGALNCRGLEQQTDRRPLDVRVEECARRLGNKRSFYTTRDSVEDIEAVRRRVGDAKIDLYGVSYGTKVAVAYALKYPNRVERLILDSVVEPQGQNPYDLDSFAATPRILREVCRGECRGITTDLPRDVATLAARLRAAPLRGAWYDGRGRRRTVTVTQRDLYSRLRQGDLSADVRAEYPGAIRSAVDGDPAPLLRLEHRFDDFVNEQPGDVPEDEQIVQTLSFTLMTATLCEEAPLPWSRTASPAERLRQARAQAESIPANAFLPFDRSVALALDANSLFLQCSRWPARATPPALAPGPLPDVPVLVIEGREDMRTPLEVGQRVAARFRRAQVVAVPKTAHSVLGQPGLTCGRTVLRRFFAGQQVGNPCSRTRRTAKVRPKLPASIARVRRARGVRGARRQRTLGAVRLTLDDFYRENRELAFLLRNPRGGGLRGGRWTERRNRITLTRFALIPGVTITGRITNPQGTRPTAKLKIGGRRATRGTLTLKRGRLTGRLAGRAVRARYSPPPAANVSGD